MNDSDPPPRSGFGSRHPAAEPESADACEISIQNPCGYPEAGARRWRPWLESVVAEAAPRARSLAVRFVSDREMRRLNRAYRRKDSATDVLSFPGDLEGVEHGTEPAFGNGGRQVRGAGFAAPSWPELDGERHLGDIVISVPTARRQARELAHGTEREMRALVLHGLLHCLGHDHEVDDGRMAREEASLRHRWLDPKPHGPGGGP